MGSMVEIFLDRAGNELLVAESLKKLSDEEKAKEDFHISERTTFYSSVISHSYYAIFYAAKAMLLTKGITTSGPEIHRKTLDEFKKKTCRHGTLGCGTAGDVQEGGHTGGRPA